MHGVAPRCELQDGGTACHGRGKKAAAKRATEAQILEDAGRLVATWNERQAKRMPMLFSPTIGCALKAKHWFLWVRCPACHTTQSVDLRTLDRHPFAALTSLIPALSCRSCRPKVGLRDLLDATQARYRDELTSWSRRHSSSMLIRARSFTCVRRSASAAVSPKSSRNRCPTAPARDDEHPRRFLRRIRTKHPTPCPADQCTAVARSAAARSGEQAAGGFIGAL